MAAALATMALTHVLAGCALFGAQNDAAHMDPAARAARIAALREAIDRDHAELATLIAEPQEEASDASEPYPRFEPIAKRLNAHEQELARLEALDREEAR